MKYQLSSRVKLISAIVTIIFAIAWDVYFVIWQLSQLVAPPWPVLVLLGLVLYIALILFMIALVGLTWVLIEQVGNLLSNTFKRTQR